MKIVNYNWFFLFILGLFSCDVEEFFSPVVELNVPLHTSKLVVSAEFAPNSDLRVYVSKSYSFLDPKQSWSQTDTVAGVQVQLFKNDALWATFRPTQNGFYASSQKIPLNDASTYRIQVSAPNYETVTATQKVPATVPITKATFTSEGGVEADGTKVDLYTMEFNDPANDANFYQAEATWLFKSLGNFWQSQTYTLLNLTSTTDNEKILTDNAFNGKPYKWLLKPNYSRIKPNPGDTITVQLTSISKDKYLYDKSRALQRDAQGNPFAEPVLLYTNLQKGYGIFTISGNYTEKKIVF